MSFTCSICGATDHEMVETTIGKMLLCAKAPVNGIFRVVDSRIPCEPYPEDASYKTIALDCPRCGTALCWRRYLSWEKSMGIDLNEKDHPAEVDDDHR